MKHLLLGIPALAPLCAAGQLVVTEIMSNSNHLDTTRNGDWWELTNTGTSAVNLQNYSWDDDAPVVGTVTFNSGITIAPGESIVILDEADATNFKIAWGLTGTNPATSQPYQVLIRSNFSMPPLTSFPGLSSNSQDGVHLYNAASTLVDSAVYTTASALGCSRVWFTNNVALPGEFSVTGQLGATTSTDVQPDIASPCVAAAQPVNVAPYFTGTREAFAVAGQDLASSAFRVQAADANAGQTITFTLVSGPAWLTISPDGVGSAKLVGTPPTNAAGNHAFTVRATDDHSPTASTERAFTLFVAPASSPVILNEFNAVGSGKWLGDALAPSGTDTHFLQVMENGGDWFELVVTGSGASGTVDMRGWRIEISQTVNDATAVSSVLELSQAAYWSAVPNGTILTFIEKNTAQGGLDTGINRRNRIAVEGDAWSNIWVGDPYFLSYTDQATNGYSIIDGVVSGMAVDEKGTRFTIRNAAGAVVAGPFGEAVPPAIDVSDIEVFGLNANPSPSISPLAVYDELATTPGYKDKSGKSSFGWPNEWSSLTQSFSAFVRPLTAFETWAAGYPALTDPSPGADPDGDGRSNHTEYAFGGNPSLTDAPPVQAITRSGGTLTWEYARRSNDSALAFTHQRSLDLTQWTTLTPLGVATTPHPTLAGFVMVTVTATATPGTGQEFFRAMVP